MFGIVSLVKMLQSQHLKLSEVVAELPEFHVASGFVDCPSENKGTVMRMLAENREGDRKVELVDGIKLYNEDSWVLVLPDSFEPMFHVVAESPSLVESQSLVNQYKEMILRMRPA